MLAFTGDGGLGMTLAEIETAVRLSLRVIVIVFNDAALSLIKIKQKPAGHGGDEAVRYRPTSFAAAAAAMGAAGAAVTSERELAAALTDALARPGPTVIDAQRRPGRLPGGHGPQPGPGRTQIGTRHQPGQPGDPGEGACAVSITVAKFRDVADGIQPGQFMIGDREPVPAWPTSTRSTSGCSTSR